MNIVIFGASRGVGRCLVETPEWIGVRPLPLTNGSWTGRYQVAVDGLPVRGTSIARADVADFMVRQVTGDDYLHKVPAIAY